MQLLLISLFVSAVFSLGDFSKIKWYFKTDVISASSPAQVLIFFPSGEFPDEITPEGFKQKYRLYITNLFTRGAKMQQIEADTQERNLKWGDFTVDAGAGDEMISIEESGSLLKITFQLRNLISFSLPLKFAFIIRDVYTIENRYERRKTVSPYVALSRKRFDNSLLIDACDKICNSYFGKKESCRPLFEMVDENVFQPLEDRAVVAGSYARKGYKNVKYSTLVSYHFVSACSYDLAMNGYWFSTNALPYLNEGLRVSKQVAYNGLAYGAQAAIKGAEGVCYGGKCVASAAATAAPYVQKAGSVAANGICTAASCAAPYVQRGVDGVCYGYNCAKPILTDAATYASDQIKAGAQIAGEGIVYGAQQAGNGIVYGAQQAGQGIVYGAQQAGNGIAYGVEQAGNGIVYGAEQAGRGICYGAECVSSAASASAPYIRATGAYVANAACTAASCAAPYIQKGIDNACYGADCVVNAGRAALPHLQDFGRGFCDGVECTVRAGIDAGRAAVPYVQGGIQATCNGIQCASSAALHAGKTSLPYLQYGATKACDTAGCVGSAIGSAAIKAGNLACVGTVCIARTAYNAITSIPFRMIFERPQEAFLSAMKGLYTGVCMSSQCIYGALEKAGAKSILASESPATKSAVEKCSVSWFKLNKDAYGVYDAESLNLRTYALTSCVSNSFGLAYKSCGLLTCYVSEFWKANPTADVNTDESEIQPLVELRSGLRQRRGRIAQ